MKTSPGGGTFLGWVWRLVSAALAFAAFGLGGLLLGFSVFPLLRVTAGGKAAAERRCRLATHLCFRTFVALLAVLRLARFQVLGRDRLRGARGCLVVANHPSLIDAVVLISCLPDACCVVKESVWRNPFLGHVVRAAGYVPSRRADLVVAQVVDRLRAGQTVVLFPEGTRTPRDTAPTVRRGAVLALLRADRPVLPVYLRVTPRVLCKGDSLTDLPNRTAVFVATVGDAIEPSDFAPGASERTRAKRGAERLEALFRQHTAEIPLPAADSPAPSA